MRNKYNHAQLFIEYINEIIKNINKDLSLSLDTINKDNIDYLKPKIKKDIPLDKILEYFFIKIYTHINNLNNNIVDKIYNNLLNKYNIKIIYNSKYPFKKTIKNKLILSIYLIIVKSL